MILQGPSPKRILIIRLQHHGDVLLTTPIFSALKQQFPGVEIDALVFAETLPMIKANPDLRIVWSLHRSKEAGRGWRRIQAQISLLRQLRSQQYDWVLHLDDRWPGAWAALFSGARLRASYKLPKRNNPLWRHAFPIQIPTCANGHVVERNLAFLQALGIDIAQQDHPCRMIFSAEDASVATQALASIGIEDNYILVHPTSRWFFKCWENERFAEVILHLAQNGHKVVLTSAPSAREITLIEKILTLAPHANIYSLAGKLTLPVLASLISRAKLFIGVDSAPMHMAAALNTPTVALFGPTDVEAWRPWSDKAVVIHAANYGPLIAPNDVNTATDERYLTNIPVAPVLEAVLTLLAEHKNCL